MINSTTNTLVNRKTLADRLGVEYRTVWWWQQVGYVPAPSIQVGKRWYYTDAEQRAVAEFARLRELGRQ